MKGKALRKHSLHETTAASVLLMHLNDTICCCPNCRTLSTFSIVLLVFPETIFINSSVCNSWINISILFRNCWQFSLSAAMGHYFSLFVWNNSWNTICVSHSLEVSEVRTAFCGFKTHILKHLLFKVIPKRPPGQCPYLKKVVSIKI